jgi:DNA modification methylase
MRARAFLCTMSDWDTEGRSNFLNQLFFGDNLDVLRESIKDETVDLIYLDPPFNSSANYNVLFSSPKGHQSGAQIEAFEDTWHWGVEAEKEFAEILTQANSELAEVVRSLRQFLGENDMMAYLVMMANRLLEMHRVLKPNGSLYLHCDPTSSHYLKVVLDGVFGHGNFINEVIWKRTSSKSDHTQGAKHRPRIHDTIFHFAKELQYATFHTAFLELDEDYVRKKFPHKDPDGRRYGLWDMSGPGGAAKGNPSYEVMGVTKYWRYSKARMDQMILDGLVVQPSPGSVPREKRFLNDSQGVAVGDVWTDISPINSQAVERLGYPTQKPLALLERIIAASSNRGDVVLDPFCGCGTAVHASQKLDRQWIGIDITHLAISLIEKRLRDAFPGIQFDVHGTPKDYDGARNLAERDKYQFQWWACSLVNAQPFGGKKKGADGGVDGVIYFQDEVGAPKKIIVSVKGGENVGVTMVKDLIATVIRQKAEIGLFVTLNSPTKPMIAEAAAAGFYKSPTGATFPKFQILQIENLIDGSEAARYPSLDAGALTFKKAALEQGEDKQEDLFSQSAKKGEKKKGK